MGLFNRNRHADDLKAPAEPRVQQGHRPWVRPEFLGLFAALAVVGGALFLWSQHAGAPGGPGPAAADTDHTEYVRLADLAAWTRAHPDAQILSQKPVYQDGVLTGYLIQYSE